MPDSPSNDVPPADLDDGAGLRAKLARQAAFADALVAASPDCLERLDLAGNVLWIGEPGRQLAGGADATSRVGTCWFDWWDDVERGKVDHAIAEARAGRASRFGAWASTPTGEARCWSVSIQPVLDAAGRPIELLAASRDVTQLRAQLALAAAHRRRPDARPADADPLGDYAIVGFALDGSIESWNAAAQTLFGWRGVDVIGKAGDPLWTPEDRAAGTPAREREAAAAQGVARDERWHVRADGGRVFVDGAMLARADANGRVGGFVKICRDETAQRALADEFAAIQRRLDSALIAGEIGTFDWNLVTDRLRGDANFQRIFGIAIPPDETLPISFFLDVLHPDDLAETLRRIEATIERDERYETEYRIRHADGSERWVIARGGVERDGASGKATRFGGVLLDITDRKRAEADRRAIADERDRQARVYETILSTTGDFAYIFDLEGRVLYANRSLLKVWGVTLEQAVGLTLVELGYPVWHAAMHRKEIDEVIRTRRPIQGEIPFTGGSGIAGVYDYVFSPVIGPDGAVERVVGTTRDVTERRRAEDATRAAGNRARFLAELADATRDLLDPIAVLERVAQRLGEYLGTSRCAYADVAADDGDSFVIHRDYCNVGVASCAGRYRLDDFGPFAAGAMRRGRTLVVADVARELGVDDPAGAATFASIACRAIVCCPLIRGGRLVAMMAVHQTTPRDWSAEDVSLVEAVVERAWGDVERARGLRALGESEARFRQLADAMPQIVFAATPDGVVDYYNRRWYEYTGQREGETGDPSWAPTLPAEDLVAVGDVWRRAVAEGVTYQNEYRLRRRDGMFRWHLGRALPVRNDADEVVRWLGTNTDIHDQKLAENALAAEKVVLERIAGGASLANVLDVLTRGIESQSDDGMLCSILIADAEGRRLRHGAAPSLPEAYTRAVDGVAIAADNGSCGSAAFERRLVRVADIANDPRWIAFREAALAHGLAACSSMPILRGDGAVAGTVAVYYRRVQEATPHDLELLRTASHLAGIAIERERAEQTVRVALDAERAARAESDRAGRMKDEFLATLSHELRTPLSAILGWSQMLARDGVTAESLRKGLATIERNARAQTQIIEDLLDMSRIISGKVALDSRRILLADVVGAAIETVAPTASAKQIDLAVDLGPEPTPVLGDANRLQQVFWNLLTNAIKFTPRHGTVRVSLERRHSQWRVHVADSGEGIRADFLPFVFDRFRQADASTTRRHGGLGLGLAIVKQIAELHGGTVSVRSEGEGRGATFTVALPMSVLHSSALPSDATAGDDLADVPVAIDAGGPGPEVATPETFAWDAAQAERLAGVRVLIVDDEPDARAMLRHLLESCNAIVDEAADADAGVSRFRAFRPDVLVSDVGMPGENGYGMLARIRALGPDAGGDVPAVALTAYARADDRIRAIRAGFQLHVPKPVEPAELIASVASLVGRRE